MRLEKAEKQYLEKIVEISMKAFETDIEVGGTPGDYPPDYNSISWHEQMRKEGHLFQAIEDDKVIGGAVLFLGDNKESLYVGRIFVVEQWHISLSLTCQCEAFLFFYFAN